MQKYIRKNTDTKYVKFTKEDFMSYLTDNQRIENPISEMRYEKFAEFLGKKVRTYYRIGRIDTELSQMLADVIMPRALERGIIKKVAEKSLSDAYMVEIDDHDW